MALIKCRECGTEISRKAAQCPKCGAPAKRKTSLFTWLVGGFMALTFAVYIAGESARAPSATPSANTAIAAPVNPRAVALKNTKLDFAWRKVGFDNIMEADFTIRNNSKYAIKDITIKCMHSAKSGTVIDRNTETLYDVVKANSTRRFPKVNMGFVHTQAHSSSCYISNLEVL